MGWGRDTRAALAVQNLMWGATQPFAGMIADKYGTARVVLVGAALIFSAWSRWRIAFVMALRAHVRH
jgi:MFS family permease